MHYTPSTHVTPSWSALLKPQYFSGVVVLAGGIALYSINEFGTSSVLPSLVKDIGGEKYFAWATSLFIVGSVISSIFVPNALARWGAKNVYLIAIIVQIIGSLVCAFSPDYLFFLIGRTLQGVSGGWLSALAYALIRTILPEMLWALGTVVISLMWAVGTVCGPSIGGIAVQYGNWRLAFFMITALAIIIAILVPLALPSKYTSSDEPTPIPTFSVIIVSVAAILISIASVTSRSIVTIILLITSFLALIGLIIVEKYSHHRILPIAAFMRRTATPWLFLMVAAASCATTYEIYIPKFSQEIGGVSPLIAGFVGATLALGWTIAQIPSAKITRTSTIAFIMPIGPTIMLLALIAIFCSTWYGLSGQPLIAIWAISLTVFGSGIGLLWPHLASLIFASGSIGVDHLTPHQQRINENRSATSISTVQLMANAIGAALAGLFANFSSTPVQQSYNITLGFGVLITIGIGIACMITRQLRQTIPVS